MNKRLLNLVLWPCVALAINAQPAHYPPGHFDTPKSAENPMFQYHLALNWVKQAAESLQRGWKDRLSPEATQKLAQISEDVDYLQMRWKRWAADRTRKRAYLGPAKTEYYYRSLQGFQRRLKEAARSKSVAEVEKAIEDVAGDLRIKAANCRESDDGLGKDIIVRVRTLRGTGEVGGYEVWCVPRALLPYQETHVRFPKVSSPSVISNLSPGNYLLWVTRQGMASERIPQTIGGKGQREIEIDLIVPESTPERSVN